MESVSCLEFSSIKFYGCGVAGGGVGGVGLAWLAVVSTMMRAFWHLHFPGTTKLNRLDENIGAVSVELTPNDLLEIESAASKITVQGAWYPEKLEQPTGR
jgi:hypothetical protein